MNAINNAKMAHSTGDAVIVAMSPLHSKLMNNNIFFISFLSDTIV